jgi:WD40 repeat protein
MRRRGFLKGVAALAAAWPLAARYSSAAYTFSNYPELVHAVAFSPDGRTFLPGAGGNDGGLTLWDLATGKEERQVLFEPAQALCKDGGG